MKIDFSKPEENKIFEEKLSESLNLKDRKDFSFRFYFGISHGLNEVARGLTKLFPHKTFFSVLNGSGPYFEQLKVFFSMEGIKCQEYRVQDLLKFEEWLATLDKGTLFFLDAYDDPLTGEIFELSALHAKLHEKKIFTITLAHSLHFYRKLPAVHPHSVQLIGLTKDLCVGILGLRSSRIQPLIFGNEDNTQVSQDLGFGSKTEDQKTIEGFEEKKWGGSEPFFKKGSSRIFDRAVFFWRDMDGEAFVQELASLLGLQLDSPGVEDKLETTSLCRWGGLKTFNWYQAQGHDPEKMRGLVIIAKELITPALGPKIIEARNRVLALQR